MSRNQVTGVSDETRGKVFRTIEDNNVDGGVPIRCSKISMGVSTGYEFNRASKKEPRCNSFATLERSIDLDAYECVIRTTSHRISSLRIEFGEGITLLFLRATSSTPNRGRTYIGRVYRTTISTSPLTFVFPLESTT